MKNYLNNIGVKSKNAFKNLGYVGLKKRNNVLETYIKSLKNNKNRIIKANLKDIKLCKREELIDRLNKIASDSGYQLVDHNLVLHVKKVEK